MPTWVTHAAVADAILKIYPDLGARAFSVGSIAPDCNIENEDWTAFTPPREVTHWMSGTKKSAADSDRFCQEYIIERGKATAPNEELSFLLGYYAHLIADAEYQRMIRDETRVAALWQRVKADEELYERAKDLPENFDSIKLMFSKSIRFAEIETLEARYLEQNPDSCYITHILPLESFPDYIDYMPNGCIVRKIGAMGYIPKESIEPFVVTAEEYRKYLDDAIRLIAEKLKAFDLQ